MLYQQNLMSSRLVKLLMSLTRINTSPEVLEAALDLEIVVYMS